MRHRQLEISHHLLTKRGSNLNKTPRMAEFISRFRSRAESEPTWGISLDDMEAPDIKVEKL